jgi:hypothetical protein
MQIANCKVKWLMANNTIVLLKQFIVCSQQTNTNDYLVKLVDSLLTYLFSCFIKLPYPCDKYFVTFPFWSHYLLCTEKRGQLKK